MLPTLRRDAFVGALLAIVVAGIYAQTAGFSFVGLDDPNYVVRNPHVLGGLRVNGIVWAFTTTYEANWHPLTWISLMLDASVGGGGPRAFHVTNLALHLANAFLLYLLLGWMTGCPWRSAFVAGLFAAHPLHVESVAWIAERKDLLSAFFGLLAALAYLGYARRPGAVRYVPVLLAFALSLLAKPMLVTLPCLLLLADYWPLGRLGSTAERFRGFALVREKLPMFALSAASSVITIHAQASADSLLGFDAVPAGVRLANAAVSCVSYLRSMFWPTGLAVPYPYLADALTPVRIGGAVALIAAATLIAWRQRRRRPWFLAGWLGYLVALVPVIGIVQVGTQSMADRYTYLPLVGPFVIVAWGVPDLLEKVRTLSKWRDRISVVAAVLVTAVLAVAAHAQTRYWKDAETLFSRALSATDRNVAAYGGLGLVRFEQGRIDEAIGLYGEALRISPAYVDAHANLALALARAGRFEEAEEHCRKAIELRPADPLLLENLGAILLETGRLDDAVPPLLKALQLRPGDPAAHKRLGGIFARQGRDDDAIRHLDAALSADPRDPETLSSLGAVLMRQGKLDEAAARFLEALAIDARQPGVHNNLGVILARQGRKDEAARHFAEALRLDSTHDGARANLEKTRAPAAR
jgi:Flp pilus assembly protein TadD